MLAHQIYGAYITVLISENLDGLKNMFVRVPAGGCKFGLGINIEKTKWIMIHKERDKDEIADFRLTLNDELTERAAKSRYMVT